MKRFLNVLVPLAVFTGAVSAKAATLTFSGDCRLTQHNMEDKVIGSFNLEAEENDCPHADLNFSTLDRNGIFSEYGVYIEFQRAEFGPGLKDKPYFGYFKKGEGGLENSTHAFNAKPGNVLLFDQHIGPGTSLHCVGTVK